MRSGNGILSWLFQCHHRRLSRVFTIQRQTYCVCLDCGARLRYSWNAMALANQREPLRWSFARLLDVARKLWGGATR